MLERARHWLEDLVPLTSSKGRIPEMEGLRGLAVALVFFVHYASVLRPLVLGDPGALELSHALARVGHLGVDIFFILSGFLIYGSVLQGVSSLPTFLRRRAQRIFPTFLAVLALYLVLSLVLPGESKLPEDATEGALFVLANVLLLPGMLPITPIISVAWSLSYEFFFYLATPVLAGAVGMSRWSRIARVSALVAGSALLVAVCWVLELPHARMIEFAAGAVLLEAATALKEQSRAPSPHWAWLGAPLLLAALWGAERMSDGTAFVAWLGGATAGALRLVLLTILLAAAVYSALSSKGLLAATMRRGPLRWLGNVSYSYYLVHGLALKAVGLVLLRLHPEPSTVLFFAVMPLAFVVTVVATVPLYAGVERRFSQPVPRPVLAPALHPARVD